MKMSGNLYPQTSSSDQKSSSEFYEELTQRNAHFIDKELQSELSRVKVLLGGCGTIGGACTVPFARAGVQHFYIAEPDKYELNNLNRQPAELSDIGKNKGDVQKKRILAVNPNAQVQIAHSGVTPENIESLVKWANFIVDGVDVTTKSGIEAKILLHEAAAKHGVPVVSGLDLGFCQKGYAWSYHKGMSALNGRAREAKENSNDPLKALFKMMPLRTMPFHSMKMLWDGLNGLPVSQLGLAGDLMGAVGLGSLIRYLRTGDLVGWNVNLSRQTMGIWTQLREGLEGVKYYRRIATRIG